ncbi:cytochrome P450 [Streptacidiphilus sp. P02-A3a]|uniref:cytochrome P450 n=1 Tax=Streptacidiphilus sp. P02-A3a TaxID=2704468 RepID=UPI0015FA67CF|nr:cytochrome P450 [Streptacidiphilus sp. P02-A3a]QMU67344.1 cytochrome P450 [Streptacidiphilus sp. P02-A3a]
MNTPIAQPDAAAEHAANEAFAELLFSPEGLADPFSRYQRLREAVPVHRTTMGTWVLTRYDDVDEFLRSRQVDKQIQVWMAGRFTGEWQQHQALRKLAANLLWTNPPEHTRLRRSINQAFTEKRILEHRAAIENRFDELMAPLVAAGGGDFCNDVCFPLALSVVADLIGVPQQEAPLLRDKIRDFQRTFEPGMTAAELLTADEAAKFLDDYFADLVRQKQRRRGDDLVSALLDLENEDERLTFDELVQMCHMIIAAGSETTTFFLTNGIRLFAEHPDQADLVRADPSLLRQATEEVLRYMPSAHMIPRTTNEAVVVGGVEIPANSRVMVWIAAANRDPAHFTDPERFDVTRKESAPMSYGLGTHYCLGWRLANLQADVVFAAMLDRFTDIEITEPLRPRARVAFPQLDALRIRFRDRTARRSVEPGTVRFLSAEYLADLATLAPANQATIPHVNVRLQFHATRTPEGPVDYYLVIEKGVIVRAGRGLLDDSDLGITAAYRDLADFQSGELHATSAFVTGQFKLSGDRAKLLELMLVLQSGNYHQFTAELWARTTW